MLGKISARDISLVKMFTLLADGDIKVKYIVWDL